VKRSLLPALLYLTLFASANPAARDLPAADDAALAGEASEVAAMPRGDAERGRLVFGACRTCHYPQAAMGHNNGPNLHRIFGRVVGKQPGFDYYSEVFKAAEFVWTPQLMYAWLESPMTMFPQSTMMSLGVPDSQDRADLIAYLEQASVRDP
jgi:cytochrome c